MCTIILLMFQISFCFYIFNFHFNFTFSNFVFCYLFIFFCHFMQAYIIHYAKKLTETETYCGSLLLLLTSFWFSSAGKDGYSL